MDGSGFRGNARENIRGLPCDINFLGWGIWDWSISKVLTFRIHFAEPTFTCDSITTSRAFCHAVKSHPKLTALLAVLHRFKNFKCSFFFN